MTATNRQMRRIGLTALAATLAVPYSAGGFSPVQAEDGAGGNLDDVILLENVPEASAEVDADGLTLNALNVYGDGYFTAAADDGLTWESSNTNVAEVEDDGTVTATGQPGRTFISVTDGEHEDRIAIDARPDNSGGNQGGGPPDTELTVSEESGERYDMVGHALENLTVEEKVGQMLMPDYRNWDGKNVTEMLPEIEAQIEEYHLGGVILFAENTQSTEQTAALMHEYQEAAEKFGLLTSIDQEGGIVTRLNEGTDFPGNMALGAADDVELTYQVGEAIGNELNSLGLNMNFAPVVDVNNNADNPVIGVRSFGEEPSLVGDHGAAYTAGLQSTGVSATAKHFPGHGDTDVDSHLGLPEVPHDIDRLREVELAPFQEAIDEGIDVIMTAHVTFPEIDDTTVISEKTGEEIALPATLSEEALTGLMREELGYDGVVVTDALNMQAISDHFDPVDAVVRAVEAGTDIALMPEDLPGAAEALYDAVEQGDISESRIDASAERILSLKIRRGIIKEEDPAPVEEKIANAEDVIESDEHQALERSVADQATTVVKNDDALPLDADANEEIAVVGGSYSSTLADAVREHAPDAEHIDAGSADEISDSEWTTIEEADRVIVGTTTFNAGQRAETAPQMALVRDLADATDGDVIGIGIRNPYDVSGYDDAVDAYVAQYSFQNVSFTAAADTLFGANEPSGTLPVTIPDADGNPLYDFGHGLQYD
ncbi:glycoside hydrolase family 3 protein [Salisediminibacterium halotolerans]|uniref:glycoside hydrolase family 3 protein n=1 Tax=Salisediminibacterium halotolerans TaxID=517425 RepID=UPI000F1C39E2|nr:glycoside hydrolase family 3 protein [Salisediminibacterium halotolerans]RLJ75744.1 beta-N-acetylhexosaminidase [Actinophytocola xinjiangensis]RPE89598.1 beta-N-acetylhexosaminidase [Salisediminibacterium halotolerans]TWG36357.1 beta-N-acetylhexosaminidase [Salisediminibacterium halotolerans]GEL09120.1 beta-hexosaminidase [Salisediminibacterium halotolerans]